MYPDQEDHVQFSALQKFHQGGPDPVRCHLITCPFAGIASWFDFPA